MRILSCVKKLNHAHDDRGGTGTKCQGKYHGLQGQRVGVLLAGQGCGGFLFQCYVDLVVEGVVAAVIFVG